MHLSFSTLLTAAVLSIAIQCPLHAAPPEIILWPNGVPEPTVPTEPAETTVTAADGLTRRFYVSNPRLFVHAPEKTGDDLRAAVIVVPGGGYGRLADEHEGSDVCKWLNAQGIVAFQLAYRTPTNKQPNPETGPVQDLHRSIALVRQRAAEFHVDPDRIGVIGFSAGGLTAFVAAASEPAIADPAEKSVSSKPNAVLLIYPWKIWDTAADRVHSAATLDAKFPPTFIAQAADDTSSSAAGSARVFIELTALKVPTEFHIYEKGGHGFGMRPREGSSGTRDWQARASDWLRLRGFCTGSA
ncbi:MAG TPA: alpha/beta hydrolase [Planctomycetaceae bacterium]|nr:alpha/beta hydrolase [Planctomycetaceae bacterium]